MKLKLTVVFCLMAVLGGVKCEAQKQGNIWYFGNHAGLDFNSGIPASLSNGMTMVADSPLHAEASSVICDSSGGLLFYSDAERIWNRNHQLMPNGDSLLGHTSSTQGVLIVPLPQSNRYYYVFTTDAFLNDSLKYGFRYSVVDICLDNGLGDVISESKNIKLLDTIAEKLTAVRHANGIDYWIIVHKYYSDAFYSYHLSASGIIDTVITHIGTPHPFPLTMNCYGALGQMKASPDGRKIAVVTGNYQPAIAEYFDFDNSTGILSNWVDVTTFVYNQYYGCSFSPDNSKLYLTSWLNVNGLHQFDLTAGNGNPDSVRASHYYFNNSVGNSYGIQLAPDGKIYLIASNTNISVINYPNLQGAACGWFNAVISVGGSPSLGLPNFIDSYDYTNTTQFCKPLGTDEQSIHQNIQIFPNPTSSNSEITFTYPSLSSPAEIVINNIDGKEMGRYACRPDSYRESSVQKIKLPEMSPGIYVARLISNFEYQISNVKFVIQ